MTRKHFKELAKILNENNASKELVKDVILFCKTQNSNFDSFRFILSTSAPFLPITNPGLDV